MPNATNAPKIDTSFTEITPKQTKQIIENWPPQSRHPRESEKTRQATCISCFYTLFFYLWQQKLFVFWLFLNINQTLTQNFKTEIRLQHILPEPTEIRLQKNSLIQSRFSRQNEPQFELGLLH